MRKRTIIVTTVPLVAAATMAMAYSVAADTATGTTTASTAKAVFKTTVTVPDSLIIGGYAPVTVTVQNTGDAAEKVRVVDVGQPVVDSATCPNGSFTLTDVVKAVPTAPLGHNAQVQVATGVLHFNNLDDADQTTCLGAKVTITASASSVPK